MAAHESVDDEAHAQAVGRDDGRLHGRLGLVHLGAAVAGLVDVGEGVQGVVLGVGRGGGVDGMGELDFEAVMLRRDGAHLEGRTALEAHALEGEGLRAARAPAAVGAADEERAVLLIHAHGHETGLEAAEEMEHGALVEAVDLLEGDALDLRGGLLPDEHLALPGTELAPGQVAADSGGRIAHLAVRQEGGGRDEGRMLQALGEDARSALRLGRRGEVGEGVGLVAGRVALEGSGAQPLQGGGAVPHALVVGVEHVTLAVGADAAGRTDAGRDGDELAVRGDLGAPAAPRGVGMERAGQAEDGPDVAVLVGIGTEGVFVVVAAHAPLGADGLEPVGPAVAVAVGHAGELRTLHGEQRALLPEHPEGLVDVGGELGPLHLGKVGVIGALDDPDVAATGADGDLLAGQQRDRADFADLAGGSGDLDAFVEFGLPGLGGLHGLGGDELALLGRLGGRGLQARDAGDQGDDGEVLHESRCGAVQRKE